MSEHDENEALDELDALAAEYVLGTLAAGLRSEVERRLGHDPQLRDAVDAWEQRLLPLTERVEPEAPSAQLWRRIARSVEDLSVSPAADVSWWDRLALWRGLSAAGLAATLVLGALLLLREPAEPRYLVVLVAPQDRAPGWVIQASDAQRIRLIPLGVAEVPADKSLQFWTKGKDWQGPVSLGLVKPGQTLDVPLHALPPLEPEQLFELTLEARDGSPTGKPTGPIQAIGRAVKVL